MNNWKKINDLYIKNHLKIIPLKPNSKLPLINAWNKDCSCDFEQILYWFENAKDCNWGLPCIENDLFVLDLDTHHAWENGIESFNQLKHDLGITDCDTLMQQTPSGGIHLIYKTDEELKQVKGLANAFSDYPGIDLRNSNYIVVEPSTINGVRYSFQNNIEPRQMPEKLKEFILNNSEKKSIEHEPYVKPKTVAVGSRDDQLFSYINNLYFKTNLDYDEILVLANHFNEDVLEEPFSEKIIKQKVSYAFKKPRGEKIIIRFGGEEDE